jgi:hypothetical protein
VPAGAVGSVWAAGSWSATAWEAFTWADVSATLGNNNPDMNTRIAVFLRAFYTAPGADLTSLIYRYLREEKTGEYTARWKAMEADATA